MTNEEILKQAFISGFQKQAESYGFEKEAFIGALAGMVPELATGWLGWEAGAKLAPYALRGAGALTAGTGAIARNIPKGARTWLGKSLNWLGAPAKTIGDFPALAMGGSMLAPMAMAPITRPISNAIHNVVGD